MQSDYVCSQSSLFPRLERCSVKRHLQIGYPDLFLPTSKSLIAQQKIVLKLTIVLPVGGLGVLGVHLQIVPVNYA